MNWNINHTKPKADKMYLNKKQMDKLLHQIFVITWCESRNWADKRLTDKEMYETENRIKSFVLNNYKKGVFNENDSL